MNRALPAELAAQFRVQGELGRGAAGVVFRAHQIALKREVAIKLLNRQIDAGARARFLREARLSAQLTHPGIVQVYSADAAGETPYIVFEYVAGSTLAALIAGQGPVPLGRALDLTAQLLDALAHAHAKGIVHRDVKPPNILVQEDGQLRLADFGVGSSADVETLARTGTPIGTPGYMALEQWFGKAAAPCDVYAAGIVLHEMLTAQRPRAATMVQQAVALSAEPLPALPGVPGSLTGLLARMTEADATVRPAAADAAAEIRAIRAALDRRDVERTQPGRPQSKSLPRAPTLTGPRPRATPWMGLAVATAVGIVLHFATLPAPAPRASASASLDLEDSERLLSDAQARLCRPLAPDRTALADLARRLDSAIANKTPGHWARPVVDGWLTDRIGVGLKPLLAASAVIRRSGGPIMRAIDHSVADALAVVAAVVAGRKGPELEEITALHARQEVIISTPMSPKLLSAFPEKERRELARAAIPLWTHRATGYPHGLDMLLSPSSQRAWALPDQLGGPPGWLRIAPAAALRPRDGGAEVVVDVANHTADRVVWMRLFCRESPMPTFALPGSRTALPIQGKVGIDRRRHSTRYRFRLDDRTLDRAEAFDFMAESYEHGFEAPTPLPVELWLSDLRLEPIPAPRPARP